jgi:hypothetical protein
MESVPERSQWGGPRPEFDQGEKIAPKNENVRDSKSLRTFVEQPSPRTAQRQGKLDAGFGE